MLAIVSAQGQVYEVKRVNLGTSQPKRGGGLRGVITGFSRASRRRLIDLTLRLDNTGVRTVFLTLTFSALPTPKEAKAALKRFVMRLRRAHPELAGLWRLEYQERGSIHFHLILFGYPYTPQKEIQQTWEQCTGEQRSIVHIKLLTSVRAVFNYVSKYVAKADAPPVLPSLDEPTYQHAPGRHWGYINKDALPFAEKWEYTVADDDSLRYAMWACYALSHGRAGRSDTHARLYCQDALEMLRYTLTICTHQGWRVRRAIHRRLKWKIFNRMRPREQWRRLRAGWFAENLT